MMPWTVSGHTCLSESLHYAVAVVLPPQRADIQEGLDHLLHKQRHPFGLLQQHRLELLGEVLGAKDVVRHGHSVGLREALEGKGGVKTPTPERQGVPNPVGEQEQQRHTRYRIQQRAEQRFCTGVDPV
jgi:hypothetical protein